MEESGQKKPVGAIFRDTEPSELEIRHKPKRQVLSYGTVVNAEGGIQKTTGLNTKKWTRTRISKLADEMVEYMQRADSWLLMEFSAKHGIPVRHLTKFAKKSSKFADSLELCKNIEELKLAHAILGTEKYGKSKLNKTGALNALKSLSGWGVDSRQTAAGTLTQEEEEKLRRLITKKMLDNS